jgi:hypothetical protein
MRWFHPCKMKGEFHVNAKCCSRWMKTATLIATGAARRWDYPISNCRGDYFNARWTELLRPPHADDLSYGPLVPNCIKYVEAVHRRAKCEEIHCHRLQPIIVRNRLVDLRVFRSRSPADYRLACSYSKMDCRVFTELRVRNWNGAHLSEHGAYLLASISRSLS